MELERAELEAVLQSPLFVRSPTLARLLSHLCERMFAGESDQIKEYSIAVDVFSRPESFDQELNSLVRVQANRLRKRLAEFYSTEGASHRLHITIPVGQYVPVFEVAGEEMRTDSVGRDKATKTFGRGADWVAWRILVMVGILLLMVGGGFLARRLSRGHAVLPVAPRMASAVESPVGLPVGDEIRILAGGTRSYVDRSGKQWSADVYLTGGTTERSAAAYLWRTQDPTIYRASRQGDFSYNVPLKPGTYELRLHFAETFYGPEDAGGAGEGSRRMTVTANGKPLLSDFDVFTDAGGGRIADVHVFPDIQTAEDGMLHLNFSSTMGGRAMVSAIEVLPGARGQIRPVRIVARDVPYYSEDSRWFSADMYFKGGQLRTAEDNAAGTDDPELYTTERWGHFSYVIPVAPGKYAVTLYFIERQYRAHPGESSPGADAGSRVFNVFCNRKLLVGV
jgi:hypothetical protein